MKQAKRAAIVKELAELRKSGPNKPMVSMLDLCHNENGTSTTVTV